MAGLVSTASPSQPKHEPDRQLYGHGRQSVQLADEGVVTRYPLPIRAGISIVCVLLVVGLVRGPVHGMTIAVTVAAFCLAIVLLAYRAEVTMKEVCIRYGPFYSKRTPVREIIHLVEGRTLVLVTANSRIPLWGLSNAARQSLLGILPHHLDASVSPPGRNDASATIRRHQRWAVVAGIGFIGTAVSAVPFFKGNALHAYWSTVGQYVLLLCLVFFITMIFEAGFTWVLWSSRREIDRIDNRPAHKRH